MHRWISKDHFKLVTRINTTLLIELLRFKNFKIIILRKNFLKISYFVRILRNDEHRTIFITRRSFKTFCGLES